MIMQRRSDDINDVSNNVSFYALVCLVLVFLVIVTYGWSKMLVPDAANSSASFDFLSAALTLFKYIAAFGIAILGVVLAKGVAAERMRIDSESSPKFTNTWKAYFAVLLLISALGTMNSLLMLFLQDSLLTDAITNTVHNLQQLQAKVDENLATPEYDKKRAKIDHLFDNFEKELSNPANCGFGAESNQRFRELQAELPDLKPLKLGSGSCRNIDALISTYRDAVSRQKDDIPDANTKQRFQKRISMLETIKQAISDIEKLRIENTNLNKDIVGPKLSPAWTIYQNTLGEAQLLAGTSFGLPSTISDPSIAGMGGILEVLPMLAKQWTNPAAYLIFLFAVLFDVLLIEFFSRHLHASVVIREETIYTTSARSGSSRAGNIFEK
jgi:hypothetical protein